MLKFPVLDLSKNSSIPDQIKTILDDTSDLYEAYEKGTTDDISLRCLDLIQSTVGLFFMAAPKAFILARQMLRHELKMKCREARGKISISGWLNIEHKQGY